MKDIMMGLALKVKIYMGPQPKNRICLSIRRKCGFFGDLRRAFEEEIIPKIFHHITENCSICTAIARLYQQRLPLCMFVV